MRRSNPDCLHGTALDCFASLAMTENVRYRFHRTPAPKTGHHETTRLSRPDRSGGNQPLAFARTEFRGGIWLRARNDGAVRLHERCENPRAATRSRRTSKAPHPRYAGVDGIRIGAAARSGGAALHSRQCCAGDIDHCRHIAHRVASRGRACQRRHGACRRDRRFAQPVALASRQFDCARGTCARRTPRNRRRPFSACGDAGLRRRHARGDGNGRGRFQL